MRSEHGTTTVLLQCGDPALRYCEALFFQFRSALRQQKSAATSAFANCHTFTRFRSSYEAQFVIQFVPCRFASTEDAITATGSSQSGAPDHPDLEDRKPKSAQVRQQQ